MFLSLLLAAILEANVQLAFDFACLDPFRKSGCRLDRSIPLQPDSMFDPSP